jgi:hypothetical protein
LPFRVMARVHGKINPEEMNAQIRLVQTFQGSPVYR